MSFPAYYCKTVGEFLNELDNNACLNELIATIPPEDRPGRRSEIASWEENIGEVASVLGDVPKDAMIAFEFAIPLSEKRADCVLFGKDKTGKCTIVIIELKRWSIDNVHDVESYLNRAVNDEDRQRVATIIAGQMAFLEHPSQQCATYLSRIRYTSKAVIDGSIQLTGFAYCFNFSNQPGNLLASARFEHARTAAPLYYKEDQDEVRKELKDLLAQGNGLECYKTYQDKGYGDPPRFRELASYLVNDAQSFLNVFGPNSEQSQAETAIISGVRGMSPDARKKQIYIVNGGPGTGKTILGLRLLCRFIALNDDPRCKKRQMNFKPMYLVRSATLRESLKRTFIGDAHTDEQARELENKYREFAEKYITYGYFTADPSNHFVRRRGENYRVVFYDECHRLSQENNPAETIKQLIDNFEIIVFLLDEKQTIAGRYQSPIDDIRNTIGNLRDQGYDITMEETFNLTEQMRCQSASQYIEWVDSLVYENPLPELKAPIDYFFQICDSAMELKEMIEKKAAEGFQARICAGYCWPWHSKLREDGQFYDDVEITDGNKVFRMPWNTYYISREKRIIAPEGYPESKNTWATDPNGIRQVGCIYTTQGLEFDYIGVIVGPDFSIGSNGRIKTDPERHKFGIKDADDDFMFNSSHRDLKDIFIRNIYRVLLTRGIKGCYVYFCDPAVREYVEKRLPEFITE